MPGPLLAAWGHAASADVLERALQSGAAALSVPPADDTPVWARVADRAAIALAEVRTKAEADVTTGWPQPLASHYARFFRDGNRTGYEGLVFARQGRLTRAVLLAAVTGERAWLDEAADGIVLLCEQSTWCWPAHEESRQRGAVLPDVAAPCLDLGAADVAAQLAWADQVLGPRLDARYPGVRDRVRWEVRARVLDPFLERRDWHWLGLDGDVHNWCPWICGNVMVAALRLVDDPAARARLVALAVEAIDRYLAALPDDGSVDEGYEYWWNGACRALEALDALEHATSGALSATQIPVVRETVRFPHRMHLGGPWYLNVADARARPPAGQPWHVVHRWARRLGDDDSARHAASQGSPAIPASAELGRALTALADPEWHTAGSRESPLPASVWLPGTQVGIARSARGTPSGLTLAVKGGHNGEHHNHNDVGSVVVAVDGVPVLADAGRPTYTAQTFGPDRYAIWAMQSSWHNVPEVRGTPQEQGRRFRARDVEVVDEPDRFAVRLDLAPAYPVPGLRRWWRTATLDRRAAQVTIEDAWQLGDAASGTPSVVRFLVAGQVTHWSLDRLIVTPLDGARRLAVAWNPDQATAALTDRALEDPMLADVWGSSLARLELRLPDASRGRLVVRVEVLE